MPQCFCNWGFETKFRIQSFRYLDSATEFPIPWFRYRVSDTLIPIQSFRYLDSDTEFPIPWFRYRVSVTLIPLQSFRYLDSTTELSIPWFRYRVSDTCFPHTEFTKLGFSKTEFPKQCFPSKLSFRLFPKNLLKYFFYHHESLKY